MEILVKPMKKIDEYINADGFVLPLVNFSVDYKKPYTLNEIISIKHSTKKKIFIVINKMIENSELKDLEDMLLEIEKIDIDGIFFYDLSIITLKQKLNLKTSLVWNNTHMVTNYYTINYYNALGCKYAYLSNEITLNEILDITKNSKSELIFMLLGYPTVAFSKRKLVSNSSYKDEIKVKEPISNQQYIITESEFGTTFKYNKIRNNASILNKLIDSKLKYIYLIEDDINHDDFIKGLNLTKDYIQNNSKDYVSNMRNIFGGDTGFLYRKTVYKVKK